MLAVSATLFLAVYILGPDLLSRFILTFGLPRRQAFLSRSEEILRAVLWSIPPFLGALVWLRFCRAWNELLVWHNLVTCFSGVYSEEYFRQNREYWFYSTRKVLWLNTVILWRLYIIVIVFSVGLNFTIHKYQWLRRKFRNYPKLRRVLAETVLPRVVPWHVLLSRLKVEGDGLVVRLDVLTKIGILYEGRLADKMLGADGSLISLTLAEPRRFQRDKYLAASTSSTPTLQAQPITAETSVSPTRKKGSQKQPAGTNTEHFWKAIPTNIFVIMASEIHTINIRYAPDINVMKNQRSSPELRTALASLQEAVSILQKTTSLEQ